MAVGAEVPQKSRKVGLHYFAHVADDVGAGEPQKSRKVERHDFAYVADDFGAEEPQSGSKWSLAILLLWMTTSKLKSRKVAQS